MLVWMLDLVKNWEIETISSEKGEYWLIKSVFLTLGEASLNVLFQLSTEII